MALINCPECGHEVSDTADKCPNCGYALKKSGSDELMNSAAGVMTHAYKTSGYAGIFMGIFFLIIGIVAIVFAFVPSPWSQFEIFMPSLISIGVIAILGGIMTMVISYLRIKRFKDKE